MTAIAANTALTQARPSFYRPRPEEETPITAEDMTYLTQIGTLPIQVEPCGHDLMLDLVARLSGSPLIDCGDSITPRFKPACLICQSEITKLSRSPAVVLPNHRPEQQTEQQTPGSSNQRVLEEIDGMKYVANMNFLNERLRRLPSVPTPPAPIHGAEPEDPLAAENPEDGPLLPENQHVEERHCCDEQMRHTCYRASCYASLNLSAAGTVAIFSLFFGMGI